MKNAHFHLFLILLIVGFGLAGYGSYRTIEFSFAPSAAIAERQEVVMVEPDFIENTAAPTTTNTTPVVDVVAPVAASETPVVEAPKELTGERKQLADALERLIKDDIRMKIGSKGTRVGTLQKFINIYQGKNSTIDNAYGEGFKKSIEEFQKATGDEVDGLADPGTYQKMIDWLKAN